MKQPPPLDVLPLNCGLTEKRTKGMATMQFRISLLATLLAATYGCATEPEQKQAGAAAQAGPAQSAPRSYRTGSRLPERDEDVGSSTVGGVSKDDYQMERNSQVSPMRG